MKMEQILDEEILIMLKGNRSLSKLYKDFTYSKEFRETCDAANDLVVRRLGYNDHGIVHGKIVARNALKLFYLLKKAGAKFNFTQENAGNEEDVKLILLLSSLMHDTGNSIHRAEHFLHSTILSESLMEGMEISTRKKLAILECIYAHDETIVATSIEASIVKIADALDMEQGRARMPFEKGHMDIHTVSALAISKIAIEQGAAKPVLIRVHMSCVSGIFQVQEMLLKQIKQGKLSEYVDIDVLMDEGASCAANLGEIMNLKVK